MVRAVKPNMFRKNTVPLLLFLSYECILYSPFRGLRGTIRTVDSIPHLEVDEPFCFYGIELEGTHLKEPIWFEYDEVELVAPHEKEDFNNRGKESLGF